MPFPYQGNSNVSGQFGQFYFLLLFNQHFSSVDDLDATIRA